MSKTIYDIFISYRREGGGATAGRINDMLTADGYSVSYDVDTLREGHFDKQLLERIEQCQDFILVVDKNCFVRTIDPATNPQEDWLWQELSYALQLKKNVIPVLLAGASFPKFLPEDIDNVRLCNGPKCVHEYFDSFYTKLKDFLHAYSRMAKSQQVAMGSPTNKMPCLKLKADMDCVFFLDGEERSHLKAGIIQKLPLAKGEYELMFVSEDNDNDSLEMEFEMPEVDRLLKVSLSEVKNSRQQREEEAQRLADEKRKKEEAIRLAEERKRKAEQKAEEERKRREVEERANERTFTVNGVSFKMIRVEGGTFTMGATPEQGSDAYDCEKPAHQVTLDSYYIGETEVTRELWDAVMGFSFDGFDFGIFGSGRDEMKSFCESVLGKLKELNNNLPIENVSWDDCQEFIRKLNALSGMQFRLPTEAEWEYAARGGAKGRGYKYSGSFFIHSVAWYTKNSREPRTVKTKSPNELGLYDMSGNVWEWCQDWYGNYGSSSQTNPTGASSGSHRVLRGGGWYNDVRLCRVSCRSCAEPDNHSYHIGFRLAL